VEIRVSVHFFTEVAANYHVYMECVCVVCVLCVCVWCVWCVSVCVCVCVCVNQNWMEFGNMQCT